MEGDRRRLVSTVERDVVRRAEHLGESPREPGPDVGAVSPEEDE